MKVSLSARRATCEGGKGPILEKPTKVARAPKRPEDKINSQPEGEKSEGTSADQKVPESRRGGKEGAIIKGRRGAGQS